MLSTTTRYVRAKGDVTFHVSFTLPPWTLSYFAKNLSAAAFCPSLC